MTNPLGEPGRSGFWISSSGICWAPQILGEEQKSQDVNWGPQMVKLLQGWSRSYFTIIVSKTGGSCMKMRDECYGVQSLSPRTSSILSPVVQLGFCPAPRSGPTEVHETDWTSIFKVEAMLNSEVPHVSQNWIMKHFNRRWIYEIGFEPNLKIIFSFYSHHNIFRYIHSITISYLQSSYPRI